MNRRRLDNHQPRCDVHRLDRREGRRAVTEHIRVTPSQTTE